MSTLEKMNDEYVIVMTQNLDSFEQSLVLDLNGDQEDDFCYLGYFTCKNKVKEEVLKEFEKEEGKEYLGFLIYKQKNTGYWLPIRELKIISFKKVKDCKESCNKIILKNRPQYKNLYDKCINDNKSSGKEMKRFIVIPDRYIFFKSQNFVEFCKTDMDRFIKQFSFWPIRKENYLKLLKDMEEYAKKISPENPSEIFKIGDSYDVSIRDKIKEEINNFTQKLAIIFSNTKGDYSRCIVRTYQEATVGNYLNNIKKIKFQRNDKFFVHNDFTEIDSFTQNFRPKEINKIKIKEGYDYDFVIKKDNKIIFIDCTLALFFKNPIAIPSFKNIDELKKHIEKCYRHWNLMNNKVIIDLQKLFPKYEIHMIWFVDEAKVESIVKGLTKARGEDWNYPIISWNEKKYEILSEKNMHLAENFERFKNILDETI